MMWSVEDAGDGLYGIIRTEGRISKTVYMAYTSKDADYLIEALENMQLWTTGVPKELVNARTKPGRKR